MSHAVARPSAINRTRMSSEALWVLLAVVHGRFNWMMSLIPSTEHTVYKLRFMVIEDSILWSLVSV